MAAATRHRGPRRRTHGAFHRPGVMVPTEAKEHGRNWRSCRLVTVAAVVAHSPARLLVLLFYIYVQSSESVRARDTSASQ
jgi:hypothetical protein